MARYGTIKYGEGRYGRLRQRVQRLMAMTPLRKIGPFRIM